MWPAEEGQLLGGGWHALLGRKSSFADQMGMLVEGAAQSRLEMELVQVETVDLDGGLGLGELQM